jgi:hypothetical protein
LAQVFREYFKLTMAVIDDVAQHLHNQGIGSMPSTLKKAFLPDSPDVCIAVLDTGGIEPSVDLPLKTPTFQVMIRNTTYALGKAKLDLVRAALHQKIETVLIPNGTYFLFIFAMAEGGHLGKDDAGRHLFSINFRTKTR